MSSALLSCLAGQRALCPHVAQSAARCLSSSARQGMICRSASFGVQHRRGCRHATAAAAGTAAAVALAAQLPPAVEPRPLLTLLLWDLDNVPVRHPLHLPLVARRVAAALRTHFPGTCCGDAAAAANAAPQHAGAAAARAPYPLGCSLVAYANEATLTQLGGGDAGQGLQAASAALALIGGRLEAVPNRRQGALQRCSGWGQGCVCRQALVLHSLPHSLAL